MTTHHSHSRRSQNILCSQDCVIGDVGEHVPDDYRDHRHDDSQGDISVRKGNTHSQRTSCHPLLCTVLLQILSGSTIDCSQVNPQTYSSHTALGKTGAASSQPYRSGLTNSSRTKLVWNLHDGKRRGESLSHAEGSRLLPVKRPPIAPTSRSMRTCLHRKPGGAYPEPATVCQKHPGSSRCGLQRR